MIYFVADIHLGLKAGPGAPAGSLAGASSVATSGARSFVGAPALSGPEAREARFVAWLRSINRPDTEALWLLGDIWDFWYEYRDVIPREGVRVIAAIVDLLDAGVKVYFVPGNHDVWLYSFWQKLGVKVVNQPQRIEAAGKRLIVGHGDGLGGAPIGYRIMSHIFHSKVCQVLFSTLHPWFAFGFGNGWSNDNRKRHFEYHFRGTEEPLYRWCKAECEKAAAAGAPVDCCLFGHFHDSVDLPLRLEAAPASRLVVLKDWIDGGTHFASLAPDGTFSVR